MVSHGGGAAGSASGDEAARLPERAVHQISGALQAAKQTQPVGGDSHQGHAGKNSDIITHTFLWILFSVVIQL